MNTEHYRARLEKEKIELEAALSTVGRRNPSNHEDWEAVPQATGQESDPVDVAELIEGFEDNTAILKDLEIQYGAVLASLTRIEDGTYGTCSVDGAPIDEARLEANPSATTCVAHAS